MTESNHKTKAMNRKIIVNGQEQTYPFNEITYSDLVALAFGGTRKEINYTVTYSKGTTEKPEGAMTKGETVRVVDGMIFNIADTNSV